MEAYAGKSFQMQITFNVFPRVSLHCKLVPAQYWEYEYGLLKSKQVSKQSTNATSQKERGHSFHQGYTDGAYRYGVPGRLSAKFGYQHEAVTSDSRPETHLGSPKCLKQRKAWPKNCICSDVLIFTKRNFYFKVIQSSC